MEHIRQFDWCYTEPETYFVKENDLDNCVTEKILQNKFRDPMMSSESDDEKPTFDWDEIFKKREVIKKFRVYVPGMKPYPPYPKLSTLTSKEHYHCLKVLCAENPQILGTEFIPRPTKMDHKVFEEVKEKYTQEQQEYIKWAKMLWTNDHCIRALRPKPPVETTYEAEFKMRAKEVDSLPKTYAVAAQIPLANGNCTFNMIHGKQLIDVDTTTLPQISIPEMTTKAFSIMKHCNTPEPCSKHPCRFVLPNKNYVTEMPLTEVHRELAQYAMDNGAQFIASEGALKCLMELNRSWSLCLSVCNTLSLAGDRSTVLVLGNEFTTLRECPRTRTYRAFRHLLEYTLIPDREKSKLLYKSNTSPKGDVKSKKIWMDNSEDEGSDDEMSQLFIDADERNEESEDDIEKSSRETSMRDDANSCNTPDSEPLSLYLERENNKRQKLDDIDNCTCKETIFERPPPRSFKKWQVKNVTHPEDYNIIIHCAHKVRNKDNEIILEPTPEYQIDLGASELSVEKVRSLALSLYLRTNASVMNVRVEGPTGEAIRIDNMDYKQLVQEHGDLMPEISNTIGTALNQLVGLLPGNYLLQHEPSHGTNALLYRPRPAGDSHAITLQFDCAQLAETDEAKSVKTPPTLSAKLLPVHKYRKILPCAFTPYESQLPREPRKSITKHKAPPQAISWPKKKKKKTKKNQNKTS